MRNIDFLAISDDTEVLSRCMDISQEFGYSYRSTPTVDSFSEHEVELKNSTLILVSAEKITVDAEISGMVQVIKYVAPESYIIVSIDSKLDPSVAIFIKKSGANLVLMNSDIRDTCKLEYVTSQKIKSSFLPIKIDEILAKTKIDCSIYHSMPLNKKFIPVITAGSEITEERIKKLHEIKVVYIRRSDLEKFQKYNDQNQQQLGKNSAGQVRSRFLSLTSSFADLVLLLIDQSEKVSFSKGNTLYEDCTNLARLLLETISGGDNGWEIIQESASGNIGVVERSAAIAAYAGLMSHKAQLGDPIRVMTACLLADIGILDFSPQIGKKIRQEIPIEKWEKEHRIQYENHPLTSLNNALARKFQIPEEVKEIIICSHETLDKKGFPNHPRPEKIPLESLLMQVAEKLDRASFVPMGKAAPNMKEAKKEMFEKYVKGFATYNFLYVEKLKSILS